MTAYRIILIVHLMGLAFGMGGASAFDAIFLIASRRGRVTRELVEVVHAAAGLVAGAMVLLVVSGIAFFEAGAVPTPKFWAKMVIVGIACLNGLVAHRLVFPFIETAASTRTGYLSLRPWPARLAAASAAVSAVSWSGALVLGAWHGLKLGLIPILLVYASILAAAVLVSAIFVAPRVFVFDLARSRRKRTRATAAAQSLALVIGNRALAFAGRLSDGSSWPELDDFEPRTAPVSTPDPGWRPVDGARDWPRGDGAPPSRRLLPQERFEIDDRRPWLSSRDRTGYGIDDELPMGGH